MNLVIKNKTTWQPNDFDRWGRGRGLGVIVDSDADGVDVRWPAGRCYESLQQLHRVNFKPGDVLGFVGHAPSSAIISLGSIGLPYWSLSHVGIVGELDGQLVLFHSTTDDEQACLLQGVRFNGSQCHDLERAINGYPGKAYHYPISRPLYQHERDSLNEYLIQSVGRPYDTLNAVRSGGFIMSLLQGFFRRQSLNRLFCSEYVVSAHAQIGLFATCNASRWNPSRLVRAERLAGILCPPTRLK